MNIIFGRALANFENRVIYAHFWPISPYKAPKSKTYGANGQYVSKNLKIGIRGPHT